MNPHVIVAAKKGEEMTLKHKKLIKGLKCFATGMLMAFLLVIFYKTIISGHTMPKFKENSIARYENVLLGGHEQSILIRGDNVDNPVLLYLHGGPGNPETSFIIPYQREWEKKFVVVNWDQINSGRSYDKSISSEEITTDAICKDTLELVEWLKKRFNVEKVYLVGHSYGTYVGMRCIKERPQDFYAYIGTGQVGNQQENEQILIDYAKKRAMSEKNAQAITELNSLGKLPYSRDEFGQKISISRKWTTYYGGAVDGKHNLQSLYIKAFFRPEYSVKDFMNYFKGQEMYYTNTARDVARWELFNANLNKEIIQVEVPVYFIQGANDYITSYATCETYFKALEAPYKEIFKIEGAAHNVIVEKEKTFSEILLKVFSENKM